MNQIKHIILVLLASYIAAIRHCMTLTKWVFLLSNPIGHVCLLVIVWTRYIDHAEGSI